MKYTGTECPSCGKKFEQTDDVVVCPICGTPQHRSCWNENGKCINEEKHIEGFIWQMQDIDPAPVQNTHSQDMKICPRCGEYNATYEPVCIRCGERLKANRQTVNDQMPSMEDMPYGDWQTQPNPNNFSPYQNVYAADARSVYGVDAKIEDIPVTEIAEYVQKDSTKYIGKFLDMQEKKTKLSWNWSAGIFSAFWCFYRKMVGLGIALMAIFFSVSLVSSVATVTVYQNYKPEVYAEYEATVNELVEFVSSDNADMTEYYDILTEILKSPINITAYVIQITAVLLMSIIMGFFGNHFYKKKILKDIRTLRRVSGDSMTYHIYLRHKGNVSAVNLMLPVLFYMFFSMMATYI